MKHFSKIKLKWDIHIALFVAVLIALVLTGLSAYAYHALNNVLSDLEKENTQLATDLDTTRDENSYLLEENQKKQEIIDHFQGQISEITSTVGTLDKLAHTDEELLKKYSKIYFLNENYVPQALTQIEKDYVFTGATGNFSIHAQVWSYLKRLIDDARKDEVELLVASAYRSFATQATLKNDYKVTYGSGANQFSADQGYSEHQLGTSLDFTSPPLGALFSKFSTDPGYKWLLAHAHEYGFILSYPESNTYYKFEPWHWRFVGVALATEIHNRGVHFYDLSQREIDEYLIKLFD